MTQIEDLVRQALAETPTAVTTTDPLTALDRRVRKARRWVAAGAGAVAAAVVAAIVVPLAVLSGGNDAANNKLIVGHTATPSAGNPPGVTTWWSHGAVSIASPYPRDGARPWILVKDNGSPTAIAPVDPNGLTGSIPVEDPADYVVAGDTVWTVGTDGSVGTVRVSAVDPVGDTVTVRPFTGAVEAVPAAVGNSLYVLTADNASTSVRRFVLSSDGIDESQPLEIDGATEIAATSKGHVWVLAGQKLSEVITNGQSLSAGSTVDWSGDIYGPMGADSHGDDMWAYDGDRLIGLTPKYLSGCVSCAEGYRINVSGRPVAVATADDGGLFVAAGQKGSDQVTGAVNDLYFYAPQDVQGAGQLSGSLLHGANVVAMAADPSGGVDYVNVRGELDHWDP